MHRARGLLYVWIALAGTAVIAQAAPARTGNARADTARADAARAGARAASSYIGSVPPSAADRRGLLRAFHHVHSARSHVLLVGFRECCVFSNTPGQVLRSAAAYLLTAAKDGSYGSAVIELYRRAHGNTWVHVARFKNTTPDWNDVYNLGAGFLWRVAADGTGAYDYRVTTVATDGSYTDVSVSHVNFTWNFVFRGSSSTPGADNGLNAPRSLAGPAIASATYSDTPERNASCTGRVKDTSTDGSPNMSYAEFPQDGATKALDFTVQLMGGSTLNWPAACDSSWATFPEADRLLVGARMPIAVAVRDGIYELGGDHGPGMHAQPFSYPVDDSAPPVVKQATPHQSSSENDGDEISGSTEDLRLAGRLHFRLVGLFMPLGLGGSPHAPVRADGHVPPVL